ncbi:NACHT domain-containing protein [Exiguobacterium sp. s193]|uniref:NACHT domain-containing protein n=1 Tax=Exiguobacterium sp. s193 TaxID=2751207 RepID=UPI001BEC9944|nr:NACHT domain-containing protein [Exiguobacterium sp. s193]
MIELDFTRIRAFDGSKDGGFEELVCQIAHLNKPNKGKNFIRKDGAGGDAGVECYWVLEDGSEHAWQAKYFTDRLEDGQWSQIDESVKTAIEKHPRLTKYYVSVPKDLNDSRKKGRGGKQVKSSLDKWNQYVESWIKLATDKGMNVEFEYFGRHELSMLLQRDESNYVGRTFYWFNEPVLSEETFTELANRSKISLGERFSEEYHVSLPIQKKLEGLGISNEWKETIDNQKKIAFDLIDKINRLDRLEHISLNTESKWTTFKENATEFKEVYLKILMTKYDEMKITNIKERFERLKSLTSEFSNFILENPDDKSENWRNIRYQFREITGELNSIEAFVFSIATEAYETKSIAVLGDAGIGKSHLLCDIAQKRIAEGLPTVFILGQRYSGGNPLNFLAEELDLKDVSFKQLLGALDAAGEAKRTRTLIIIDALNEGNGRFDWQDQLTSFITELKTYPHISLLISCRSTYKQFILPEEIKRHIVEIIHTGFKGFEHRAAMKYLSKQGIDKPSVPLLSPEFSNPLFLKTCCKAIKSKGLTSFPKGLEGQSAIFNFYLESIESVIKRRKKYMGNRNVSSRILSRLIELIYPDNLFGVEINLAANALREVDPKPNFDDDLIDILISEGLLALDMISDSSDNAIEVVRFTYERFSDYFIAENIINNVDSENLKAEFSTDGKLEEVIKNPYKYSGIIEALGIVFPERFKLEFVDFISDENQHYNLIFDKSFTDVLLLRSKDSIGDRTLALLNEISNHGFFNKALDKILALSTEPDHPLNAEFLHKNLKRIKFTERDYFWSTHIAVSDYDEDEAQPQSVTRTLIDWSLYADLRDVEDERIKLLSYVLLWMTSTTNIKVRDQSTKSLVRILSHRSDIINELLSNFKDIDDLYLKERLYAVSYGVVCNINDPDGVREIAENVYKLQFIDKKPDPHLLLRDYARGIMEYALNKNLISEEMSNNFRPPYISEWPIENPTASDIEDLVEDEYSTIKNSLMGYPGDFGNYTMSCVHDWSATPSIKSRPETSYELHLEFADKVPIELREEYLQEINQRIESYGKPVKSTIIDDILAEYDLEELFKETDEIPGEISIVTKNVDSPGEKWDSLKRNINDALSDEDKEYFRWLTGLGINDRAAIFSRKWAQRWVLKKVYDLGWDSKMFYEFERRYCDTYGREGKNIERIGKKYQWIAFYELLARMADNLYWADRYDDEVEYEGPWQLWKRDIDPTIWLRATNDSNRDEFGKVWWSPYTPIFSVGESEDWVFDEDTLPDFENLLIVTDNKGEKWHNLRSFRKWTNKTIDGKSKEELWYRINTCIISKIDMDNVFEKVKDKPLFDPSAFAPRSSSHQGYLREYPWHLYYRNFNIWQSGDDSRILNIQHLVPVNEYEWESGGRDDSTDQYISLYLPNQQLIKDLYLKRSLDNFSTWESPEGDIIFMDSSELEKGPSAALIKSNHFEKWLEEKDLQLIWFIGGEKQIFNDVGNVSKRLEFNYIISIEKENLLEINWKESYNFKK